jgi:hypothetical protein
MWQSIQEWFKNKGGFTHVMGAVFTSLMMAYVAVPSFHQYVLYLHSRIPGSVQDGLTAALGLYAWYRNSQKKPAASDQEVKQ